MASRPPHLPRLRLRRVGRLLWVRSRRFARRSMAARAMTGVVIALAALMATVGALSAQGGDLRAGRNHDLTSLVEARANENKKLAARVATQRAELDKLNRANVDDPAVAAALDKAAREAGAEPVRGPAVRVVLDDAPSDVAPAGVDEDLLVIHQQDIQMVVNLLWSHGAEAMTIQGQRVVSTTAVKCVGNSVVLHDVPYAPPYEILAIGDPDRLLAGLDASPEVGIFKQYVEAYQLGWKQEKAGVVNMPAHPSGTGLKFARPPR